MSHNGTSLIFLRNSFFRSSHFPVFVACTFPVVYTDGGKHHEHHPTEMTGLETSDIVTVCIYTIIGSIGIVGNSLVLFIFRLLKSRKSQVNSFILSQALADFVTSLFLVAFGVSRLHRSDIYDTGFIGEFLCRFWWARFFVFSCFAISTFNLTAMSVERFIAVVLPLKYPSIFNKQRTMLVIIGLWIVAPTMQWIFPIWLHEWDDSTNSCSFQQSWSFQVGGAISGVTLFVWEYFIPVMFMLVAYTTILKTLKRKENQMHALASQKYTATSRPGNAGDETTTRRATGIRFNVANENVPSNNKPKPKSKTTSAQARRRNVTVTLFTMLIVYVICWTPNQLTFLQFNLGGGLDFNGPWYHVTVFMAFVNTCINPFIYALKHKQFQKRIMVSLRCHRNGPDGNSQTSHSISGTVVD